MSELVGPAVKIRRMAESDADAVQNLCLQLGYPAEPATTAARVRAVLAEKDADAFVAEDDRGDVVGWVHVYVAPHVESGPYAELGGLVVDEGVRGSGIGKALVAQAEAWARSRGIGDMLLRSNVIRDEAHEFYKRLGFEVTKTQHRFRKKL